MGENDTTQCDIGGNDVLPVKADGSNENVRALTDVELAELRRDMAESSARMKAELARRRNMRK